MDDIRVGIIGVSRGMSFAKMAGHVGMKVVAVCDVREERLKSKAEEVGAVGYTDYDRFLEHDLDAVILCNYFHQHAPFAIKALEAGKHVMSECSACKTLGEGVALARAVEKSGKVYMFAENYAYFAYVQEMRRLYQRGDIGEVQYAQGEYIHPMDSEGYNRLAPGMKHWRNHIPSTYYCTHALSPIMHVTDTSPVSVNAQSIARSEKDTEQMHVRTNDSASVIVCRLDNGAMATLNGISLRGHGNWYRFHGTRGLMENLRHGSRSMLRIAHEPWDMREGEVSEMIYQPEFPVHADLANKAGHGGGDFFTCYHFAEAIRRNEQPCMNVYRALAMSTVGIQGWRSCLDGGAGYPIPDFSSEAARAQYENDHWSPFPEDRRPGQPWPSIRGEIKPTPEAVTYARKIWDEMGYKGE